MVHSYLVHLSNYGNYGIQMVSSNDHVALLLLVYL